jgi:cytosine/adenosine deaminase-related metal-dependent hydrolase
MTRRFRARWVFPVDREPIENGIVEVSQGKIVALSSATDSRAVELGNVALLPGLVNAHTHLELSDVRTPLRPTTPFTDWLAAVIGHRRQRSLTEFQASDAVQRGCSEVLASGTTLLGDIVSTDWNSASLPAERPRTIAFLELLGLSPGRVAPQLEAARRHLEIARSVPDVIPGLSPHAPYSVHPDLFHGLVDIAAVNHAPLAFHLAETKPELELLADGTGPFVDFLTKLGVWRADAIPSGTRPLDYLRALATLDRALAVHGNYLSPEEIELLSQTPGITVVYCPRTHFYFGHEPHPWRQLLAQGTNVALGTDSRASNPDLSLWKEVLHLRERFPDTPPSLLLELATRRGARALGEEERIGTLTPGKDADLTMIAIPEKDSTDPYDLLFASDGEPSKLLSGT